MNGDSGQTKPSQGGLSWSTPGNPQPQPAAQKVTPEPAKQQPASKLVLPAVGAASSRLPAYSGLLVGGIIVGVLLAWSWSAFFGETPSREAGAATTAGEKAGSSTMSAPEESSPAAVIPASSSLLVHDQPAGTDVSIASLTVSQPTWVVVYESRNGEPGNALGAGLFFAGDANGSVTLLRGTEAGQTYLVGERIDDGDRIFSMTADTQVRDKTGAVLWASFKAQ